MRERTADGRRIAELLASEIEGGVGLPGSPAVVEADPDVDPTPDGALAYAVVSGVPADADEGERGDAAGPVRVAEVYVHPDRARLELLVGQDSAVEAAERADLRVRPKAVRPPRTLVFLEDGAEAKRARDVLAAAIAAGRRRAE